MNSLARETRPRTRERHYQMEIGTRAMLTMFAALALVCGMFFAFGFTLGKHSVPASFSLGQTSSSASPYSPAATQPVAPPPLVPAPPVTTASAAPPSAANANSAAPPNPGDLSAAESDQMPATLNAGTPTVPPSATPAPSPAPTAVSTSIPAPQPAVAMPGGAFAVQVFAGQKEADALNLAAALKARQYPVFVLRPAGTETTFRVQVGPFATMGEAQTMRDRLSADGYSAVIKQ